LPKSELTEFLLGVTQHLLIGRVRSQKTASKICESYTDGRVLKHRPPPLLALAQGFFGALSIVNIDKQVVPADDAPIGGPQRKSARREPAIGTIEASGTEFELEGIT